MDFRQARYFIAAIEQRNMSAAARVCGSSQPTLSAQVRRLEIELGETLFNRTALGLRPTPSAVALYRRLLPVLADAAHALRYLQSRDDRDVRQLTVGVGYGAASLLSLLARRAVRKLETEFPHLKIVHRSSESEPLAPRSDGIWLSPALGKSVPSRRVSVSDRWILVELGSPQRNGAKATVRRDQLSQFDGYIDVPLLSSEIQSELVRWSRAGTQILMNMTEEDATGVISSILLRNHGRVLLPLLAVKPDLMRHPRLRVSRVDAGLPPLDVVMHMSGPKDPLQRALTDAVAKSRETIEAVKDAGRPAALPDLRQLRYFLKVFEEGSISRAAGKLNVVQPAVSMQIRALERQLGARLFDRSRQGISPTPFGRRARTLLAPIVDALQAAGRTAAVGRAHARQTLRVGVLPGLDEESLLVKATTSTIVDWRKGFPHIDLRVVEAHSGVLLEWLRENIIDVAVVEDMHGLTSFKETILSSEPLAILTSARHPIHAPGPIGMSEIAKLNLVLPSPRHGLRSLLDRKFVEEGLVLVPKLQLDSMAAAMRLVKDSGWATVMPASAVRQSIDSGILIAHPIVRPVIMRELRSVQLPRNPKRVSQNEFIRFLRMRLSSLLTREVR
jgi:DNA-binding transcriptional LysR family regulator